MSESDAHVVWTRRVFEVSTDDQRRCYNGVHFSSRIEHGRWEVLTTWDTKEMAEACLRAYANEPKHGREYKVLPLGESP